MGSKGIIMRLVVNLVKFVKLIFGLVLRPLIIFTFKIYYSKWDKTKPLKPVNNQLLLLSATELAQKLRRKEVCKYSLGFK
jgi:hypothetical protein